MTDLFKRDGTLFEGKPQSTDTKRWFYSYVPTCGRCGGAGGSEAWRHTGYTCYQCGGRGTAAYPKTAPLYTAAELVKLEATAAKKRTRKAAGAVVAAAAHAEEVVGRIAALREEHAALLTRMRGFIAPDDQQDHRSAFVADVHEKALARGVLTEGQVAAVVKAMDQLDAADARKAQARHLGVVGEKIEAVLKVDRKHELASHYGTSWLVTLRDEDGNAVVYMGNACRYPEGFRLKVRATVTEHGEFRGEPQTRIKRPKFEDAVACGAVAA